MQVLSKPKQAAKDEAQEANHKAAQDGAKANHKAAKDEAQEANHKASLSNWKSKKSIGLPEPLVADLCD